MPRPRNDTLHNFFDHIEGNSIMCNNGNCCKKILHLHTGNLERHLKTMHLELYLNYIEKKNAIPKYGSDRKITKPLRPPKNVNTANIELAIVEFFTKNVQSLAMIEDQAFKILVQPAFDEFNMSLNEHDINKEIIEFSQKLKAEMINDLKGKLLSLKIDVATRQDLYLLGINVQYIENRCIQVVTLAVKKVKCNHTNEYLNSLISDVLNEYAIDMNQILTITTDNGASMMNVVKDVKAELQNSFLQEENVDGSLEEDTINNNFTEDWIESIRSNFSSYYNATNIQCGAYILQLCVDDALKQAEIQDNLEKCRFVVRKLKLQTHLNYKKPIIVDCPTRWHSTYNMLEMLLEINDLLTDPLSSENTDFHLSTDIWNFINAFLKIFKPVYTATIKLQSELLCFSELYIILMDILFRVESLPSNEITKSLADALNRQKSKLFDIDLFNAAIFLDPRIKVCMDSEQKTKAKLYITSLHKRLNSLQDNTSEIVDHSTPANEILAGRSNTNHTSPRSFSEFLENLEMVKSESMLSSSSSSSFTDLETDFRIYEQQSRLPLNSNIIDFWSKQNNTLSILADIILSIPFTQVSMEQLFSALKYILSDQRNLLKSFHLEHILLVKLNGTFNYDN